MIEQLTAWARGIVVVVGLAALVEMLLPSGNFRRFGHLMMGLFVMLAMAKPLLGMMQVPVTLEPWRLAAVPSQSGYAWQPVTAPAGTGASERGHGETVSSYLADQVQRLVAWTLQMDYRDVTVEVWQGSSMARPQYIRIRLLRMPTALTGGETPAGTPTAVAEALAAQIASVYRMDQANVEVVIPR